MSDFFNINKEEVLNYFKAFLKNPIVQIRTLPPWEWNTLILINVLLSAISGAFNGLFSGSFLGILYGLFFFPILIGISYVILAGFLYYFFMFLSKKELPFQSLLILITLANLPVLATNIISPIASPLNLLGVAGAGLLLIVGLVDGFQTPKQLTIKMVIGLFVFHFLIWIWGHITVTENANSRRTQSIEREDIDRLEREIKELKESETKSE